MRKQTKIAAMVSAAALLTIGAVMTSSAATAGWQTDDGGETWFYTDRYGDKVTNEWKKSGDKWFYMGDDGYVVTSQLLTDTGSDGAIYYVDSSGAKVTNQWRVLDNTEGFVLEDGDEPSSVYYYFGSDGKATKASSGKKYAVKSLPKNNNTSEKAYFIFDEDGRMMSGWVHVDNDKVDSGEDVYYLGDETEGDDAGVVRTGWQYIEDEPDMVVDPYEDSHWYWFSETGKSAQPDTTRYINGQYYSFNENRQMDSGWFSYTPSDVGATPATLTARTTDTGRLKTGWTKRTEKDEDELFWYYLINERGEDGKIKATVPFNRNGAGRNPALEDDEGYAYAARSINNKIYLFNNMGQMISGVVAGVDAADSAYSVVDDFKGAYVYNSNSKVMDQPAVSGATKGAYVLSGDKIYYFNNIDSSSEGQMAKNARVTVNDEGETFYYHFDATGAAYTDAIVSGILYGEDGRRIQSDSGWMAYQLKNDTIYYKNSTDKYLVPKDSWVAVNSSGRVRVNNSSSVRIDGANYTVTWTTDTTVTPTLPDETTGKGEIKATVEAKD